MTFTLYTQELLDNYYLDTKFVSRTTRSQECTYFFSLAYYYMLMIMEALLWVLCLPLVIILRLIMIPLVCYKIDETCKATLATLFFKCMNIVDNVNDYKYP